MSTEINHYSLTHEQDIDLKEILSEIIKNSRQIAVFTIFISVLGVLYSLTQPNLFISQSTLISSDSQKGSVSSFGSQLGGMAELAGIANSSKQTEKTVQAIAIFESRAFSKQLIDKYDLWLPVLAIDGWNQDSDTVTYDEEIYDSKNNAWIDTKGSIYSSASYQKAHQAYHELMSISVNKETGLLTLSVTHYSPGVAQQIAQSTLESLNNIMRETDIQESELAIKYLKQELSTALNQELRIRIFNLIQSQIERIMMANVSTDFALKIIDPPSFPEQKTYPRRAMISILSAFIGFFISLLFIVSRFFFNLDGSKPTTDPIN
mgnify:CR=1 FL=1